jgi:hypothetical protein
MENLNESANLPKQRHGCVTVWLILMIVANSFTAILYLFGGDLVAQNFPGGISSSMLILLAIMGIANVIFSIQLFKWKKIGFWGFVLTSIGALIINLNVGVGIGQSLLGLVGLAILYGVLQIGNNGVPAWKHLE